MKTTKEGYVVQTSTWVTDDGWLDATYLIQDRQAAEKALLDKQQDKYIGKARLIRRKTVVEEIELPEKPPPFKRVLMLVDPANVEMGDLMTMQQRSRFIAHVEADGAVRKRENGIDRDLPVTYSELASLVYHVLCNERYTHEKGHPPVIEEPTKAVNT